MYHERKFRNNFKNVNFSDTNSPRLMKCHSSLYILVDSVHESVVFHMDYNQLLQVFVVFVA